MKRLAALAFLLCAAAFGQPSPPQTIIPGSPPGGIGAACTATTYGYLTPGGAIVTCVSGVWTVSGGSSGGTVTNVTGTAPIAVSNGSTTPNITCLLCAQTGVDINSSFQVKSTHLTSPLPLNQGGTATTNPFLTAGTNVTITGTWPNNTIAFTGGVINSVGVTFPLASTGGATPVLSISGVTAKQGNGTKVQLSKGATTTNDCVQYDANGNTVDSGSPCGGGGSGITLTTTGSSGPSTLSAGVLNVPVYNSAISGLTTNTMSKATSSTTIGDSSVVDDGTTVTTPEPVITTATMTTGPTPPASAWFTGTAGVEILGDGTCTGTVPASTSMLCDNAGVPYWYTASGGTNLLTGGISGLTTNRVPKATSSTSIGNSSISDSGTAVTITEPVSIVDTVLNTSSITTPAVPLLTTAGIAGSTTRQYAVMARNSVGTSNYSPIGTIATSNATLSGSNYVIVSTAAVTGSTTCDVYDWALRGYLDSVACGSAFHDTGQAGNGSNYAPDSNTSAGTFISNFFSTPTMPNIVDATHHGNPLTDFSAGTQTTAWYLGPYITAYHGTGQNITAAVSVVAETTDNVTANGAFVASEVYSSSLGGSSPQGFWATAANSSSASVANADGFIGIILNVGGGHIDESAVFHAQDGSKGFAVPGATFTNYDGYLCDDLTVGSSRNSCLTSNVTPGSGKLAFNDAGGAGITTTGTVTALNVQINAAIPPTDNSTEAATTAFVQGLISTFNQAVSVQAATTAILSNTPTYNNGTAGVGATLTAGSNGALTIDGYTVLLNDRVLVNNQAAQLQNGVYALTTLGTGGVHYVLTRETDFNTPTLINGSGAIPVLNGTVNNNTIWVLNVAITTIGTSAIKYNLGAATVTSVPSGGTGKTSFTAYAPVVGGTTTTAALQSTVVGTAKQIFVSGGNAAKPSYIDFPDVKVIPAANCVAGTAGGGWSAATSTFTAACRAGSNNLGGAYQAIPSTGAAAQFMVELPLDWDTAAQPYINIFYGSGSNTSGTVIWTVSSACSKADGSVTDDPAFNAESAFGSQTMAAASRTWSKSGQYTAITSGNNCIPGGSVIMKVAVSGTASANINAYQAVITIPRLITVQGN